MYVVYTKITQTVLASSVENAMKFWNSIIEEKIWVLEFGQNLSICGFFSVYVYSGKMYVTQNLPF